MQEQASRIFPDQSYYLHLPKEFERGSPHRLLVVIHGLSRGAAQYAEHFLDFADRSQYVVLAPVFPHSRRYQDLGVGRKLRSDLRLLELVGEVAGDLAIDAQRFDIFGYSGGAQFVHRFLYFHAARLRAAVMGAPGTITVPSTRQRWPAGLKGLRKHQLTFDRDSLAETRVLLLVGENDVTLEDLNQSEAAMQFGTTRLGRARALHAAWLMAGIQHQYLEVPNAGHGLDDLLLRPVFEFLANGAAPGI